MQFQLSTISLFKVTLDERLTHSLDELKSKIVSISASQEETKNASNSVIAFRVTCAKNFPDDNKQSKSENPGKTTL